MKYLALDTSGAHLTVIAVNDEKTYTYYENSCKNRHSVDLMPKVEEAISKTGLDLSSADFIACAVGAGSFTGIRIGVSAVKGLCLAYGVPALGVTSFDTIAYNVSDGKILSIIDAGHGGYYACAYDGEEVKIPPSYLMKDKVMQLCKEYRPLSGTPIEGLCTEVVPAADGLKIACEKKAGRKTDDLDALEPVYVRKSQAEEGR